MPGFTDKKGWDFSPHPDPETGPVEILMSWSVTLIIAAISEICWFLPMGGSHYKK
jgi:hypothetical protein